MRVFPTLRPSARTWLLAATAAAGSALTAGAAAAAPANVLVTLPEGAKPQADLAATVASWRQSGEVSDVIWLNGTNQGRPDFATLVELEFPTERDYQRWAQADAPKLGPQLVVRRVDVLEATDLYPRDSNNSVYRVQVLQPKVSAADYANFAKGYIGPLMKGEQARTGLISSRTFLERDPSGKGRAILVEEYRDSVAFDGSSAAEAELRRSLSADPAFAQFEKTQETVASGVSDGVARYAELPPPQLPDLPHYKPEYHVVGGLRISGSELKNATQQLADGFAKFQPDVVISVSKIGSSEGAIPGLYTGISDVAPMGDDAKITDMMPFHDAFGYMPTEISVATGGYERRGSLFAWAIVVNKDNPLNEISMDELERVFGAERSGGWELVANDYRFTSKFARTRDQNIRTWGQLGLKGDYAKKEIGTFGYSAPGFAISIERHLFHWSHKWNSNFQEYVESKQTSPDAAGALVDSDQPLKALEHDKYSIGIAALLHVNDHPGLKVLKIAPQKNAPAVALTPETVANRTYPLIRDAYFYVNKPPGGKLDPKVREFMRFVLSREGQEIMARVGYYYPLDAAYLREQLKKLD
jgi:phosphate transport system substrate-binding protein